MRFVVWTFHYYEYCYIPVINKRMLFNQVKHATLMSFGGPQLYNCEAMPFTYSVCCYD